MPEREGASINQLVTSVLGEKLAGLRRREYLANCESNRACRMIQGVRRREHAREPEVVIGFRPESRDLIPGIDVLRLPRPRTG